MKVRPWATFTSDLPDDHIENEDGDEIIQFGGKSVAAAIGEILTRLGGAVSPPIYAHEHGWELNAEFGKRRLWCQVTLIERWAMVFEDTSFIDQFLARYHVGYLDTLTRLAHELGHDPRFQDVSWFDGDEVFTRCAGAREPVADWSLTGSRRSDFVSRRRPMQGARPAP